MRLSEEEREDMNDELEEAYRMVHERSERQIKELKKVVMELQGKLNSAHARIARQAELISRTAGKDSIRLKELYEAIRILKQERLNGQGGMYACLMNLYNLLPEEQEIEMKPEDLQSFVETFQQHGPRSSMRLPKARDGGTRIQLCGEDSPHAL